MGFWTTIANVVGFGLFGGAISITLFELFVRPALNAFLRRL